MKDFRKKPRTDQVDIPFHGRLTESTFDHFCEMLRSYKDKGISGYIYFNGCLIQTDDVDKYESLDYIRENCQVNIWVGPITSVKEFKKQVDELGDWRNPENQLEYYKIMVQIAGMEQGYEIELKLEDEIKGIFYGKYSTAYLQKLYDVMKEKFPATEDIFGKDGNMRPELIGEDSEFYEYLGYFDCGRNYEALDHYFNFRSKAEEAGIIYKKSYIISGLTLETIRDTIAQGKAEDNKKTL